MLVDVIHYLTDASWILIVFIGLVTLYLFKHIQKVRSLPPGPVPLPILGNMLAFLGKDTVTKDVIVQFTRKYKGIFTLWIGPRPSICVSSWEMCKEALVTRRNDFSGRVKRRLSDIPMGKDIGVLAGDFGPTWDTLKKIMLVAVRKYSVSEKLAELMTELVDNEAEKMVREGKPMETNAHMYLITINILSSSAFGKRYSMTDPEFLELKRLNDELTESLTKVILSEYMPILRWFHAKRWKEFTRITDSLKRFIRTKFDEHKASYQKGIVRDFTDAVLAAREEAEEENKDSLEHLTDGNICMLLLDFFFAGTDTTKNTLNWALLFLCEYQDIQTKIQAEIDDNIGSRPPVQSDRSTCHYTNSVISEILRIRPNLDFTMAHKTLRDTELGGHKIPKGIGVMFNIKAVHDNGAFWEDVDKFKPERFLEPDGSFTQARLPGYLPFGLGRRACPGEKLALADIFLVLARLLQNHSLGLENGPGSVSLDPRPKSVYNLPNPYSIIVKRREK